MKGKNKLRRQELTDGRELWIQEVFYTLQGEGPFSGQPSVFVRTGGCNLRCFWCDTDFESSTWRPSLGGLLETIENIRPSFCDLIVITGGEPFRQNIAPLVETLLGRGLRVQIETNGTLWIELPESERLTIVCSPKTRGLHPDIVPRISAYKYVLSVDEVDAEDGLPARSTQKENYVMRLFRQKKAVTPIYVMPRDDGDENLNARNRALCADIAMRHGYTLCLQTHKMLALR
ncbi:7-carboxy-7-deazaguanine synthase QueE [Rhizobium leguminosarum]|uniref:7-carboxy-7-deazaguanine synthase QueE n=1 Tax=Rhizobium leguminosarum TaxID=384 RepID=UPI001A92E89A|nr:7-carboxy-7-deazaguanine synthase QueE [Rhizobium leguminosarum]MBY5413566.1 7-carboxy-7-deazaguanine synthase QueE [Rhizobium leguminosarum]MBY5551820.1 7-carboxy-7-deazaguanine synthase QueE [Rhizobium leguminosarum]MBY5558811.1 7-carboxy-7-deazaguanine synthase QueE [Rhizobium leguminosarum]QSW27737.1 7-carboxy-7-deazaguanine synthase QueE [Rhizobium leguminosarum]